MRSVKRKDAPPRPHRITRATRGLNIRGRAVSTRPIDRRFGVQADQKIKGAGAQLCIIGQVLMENRIGLMAKPTVTQANCKAEMDAALEMDRAVPGSRRVTFGSDKNCAVHKLVDTLRNLKVTP